MEVAKQRESQLPKIVGREVCRFLTDFSIMVLTGCQKMHGFTTATKLLALSTLRLSEDFER